MRRRVECGAKTVRTGEPCKSKVFVEGEHCGRHGGATSGQQVMSAPKRAEVILATLGEVEPVKDPIAALMRIAGDAMALCDALRAMVEELTSVRYESEKGDEQLRGEVQFYLQALARAESINAKIVALGLYDRKLKNEERLSREVADAVRGILEAHGVKEIKGQVVSKYLEAIDGTAEDE